MATTLRAPRNFTERKTTSATAKGLSEIEAVATTIPADGVECLRPVCGKGGLIKEPVRAIQLLATELLKGQKRIASEDFGLDFDIRMSM